MMIESVHSSSTRCGIFDEQFLQLQQLQDESSPNFVSEVINIYFHESEKLLRSLRSLLEFSDYNKMGIHLNQFMGSSLTLVPTGSEMSASPFEPLMSRITVLGMHAAVRSPELSTSIVLPCSPYFFQSLPLLFIGSNDKKLDLLYVVFD
ncbi:hypothetical protein V6N13_130079 [Hibiscus sabdariffa]